MIKTLFLLAVLGLSGCAAKTNVQEGMEFQKIYSEYSNLCRNCPYADVIHVDQCFEFTCSSRKFHLWDKSCNEIEYAEKIMGMHPSDFE